ncbi:MAG: hypothetical protein U5L01_14015 [Rheinheimera sp.]|nr:hypothetical protein [Rheinheimera sp.]
MAKPLMLTAAWTVLNFWRESYSFRAEQRDIAPWLSELKLHWSR